MSRQLPAIENRNVQFPVSSFLSMVRPVLSANLPDLAFRIAVAVSLFRDLVMLAPQLAVTL
jgi:hypothetical protein